MSLFDRKINLTRKLFVRDYLENKLSFVFGLIEIFYELGIDFDVEYLCHIEEDLIPFLLNELKSQNPYIKKDYSLLIKNLTEISIQERVYKVFPSLTSFRYLPVLDPKFRIEDDIKQQMISFCSINAIDNQKVFLFYCKYPSVFQLDLFSAINHIDIIRPDNILSEDICFVPLDYSWIALLSLEDEFYYLHIDSSNES
jgi:hypothetical protein